MARSHRRTRPDANPQHASSQPPGRPAAGRAAPDVAETPLTDAQRDEAARHLPLVHLHLRRQPGVARRGRADRDVDDLFQEGALAMLRSLRGYESQRHGSFAAYAMARIHHAISQCLYEQEGGIRVPMSTQRRRRRGDADRHDPGPPREVAASSRSEAGDSNVASSRCRPAAAGDEAPRLSHLARERFEQMARDVATDMSEGPAARGRRDDLVRHCLEERWLVGQPECRTSLRELARRAGCSLGRVTHCEAEFRRRLERRIAVDERSRWLLEQAAEHPEGFRRAMERDELVVYERLARDNVSPMTGGSA